MNPDFTLYSYRRCPFAIRARMVLHEKEIPFKTIEEDLRNFSPELRAMHPEAKVPLLVHGDLVVYESAIITEYLDDLVPENKLMPDNASDKMKVRQWTYWCNNIFKFDIDRFKYGDGRGLTSEEIDAARDRLSEYLKKIDSELEKTGWLVGDQFSLADIHVFPFYRQLSKVTPPHPEFEKFEHAKSWFEKIIARPSFEKTMAKAPKA